MNVTDWQTHYGLTNYEMDFIKKAKDTLNGEVVAVREIPIINGQPVPFSERKE